MLHERTKLASPILATASIMASIVFAGCVHFGNPRLDLSPCDFRKMVSMLKSQAQDQACLLEALIDTPEYRRFAEEVSRSKQENSNMVCLLREYGDGVFGALFLSEADSICRAAWIPVHRRGQDVAVRVGVVDSERAKVVWKLLSGPPWEELPIYRNFRIGEETSPAPYFLSFDTRGRTVFHCAVFTQHEVSYSQLFHALIECVGPINFAGEYRMLVIP